MTGEFSVWQDFVDGSREHVVDHVDAETAVRTAHGLTESIGSRVLGTTVRVIIVDGEDYTAFEWRHGEGVVFPTREQCASALP